MLKLRTSSRHSLRLVIAIALIFGLAGFAGGEPDVRSQAAALDYNVFLPLITRPMTFRAPPSPLNMPVLLDANRAAGGSVGTGELDPVARPALDSANAVETTIPVAGGVITATAVDGALFTLHIPPDALMAETRIVMTPVLAINGYELGGSAGAAVQLEPSGLQFYRPVTLTIQPSAIIPLAEEQSVSWHSDGQEFHRYPLALDYPYPQVGFSLWHFSGVGYIRSEVDPIPINDETPIPSDPEDQYQQAVEELVRRERQSLANGQGGDPNFHKNMIDLLRAYYNEIVRPVMIAAETDCDYAKRGAISKVLSWARQADLLRLEDELVDERAEVDASFERTLINCWQVSTQPCLNRNDIPHMQAVLWIAREGQLRGLDFNPNDIPECTCSGYESIPAWELSYNITFQRSAQGAEDNSGGYLDVSVDHGQTGTLLLDNYKCCPPYIGWDNGGADANVPLGSAWIDDLAVDHSYNGNTYVNSTKGSEIVGGYGYLTIEMDTCTYSLDFFVSIRVIDDSFQKDPEERNMYVLGLQVLDRNAYTDPRNGDIILSGQGDFDAGTGGPYVEHMDLSSGYASHRLFNLFGRDVGFGHATWSLRALP